MNIDWNLIYIYRTPSKELQMPDSLNSSELLVPPEIVNNQGWLKGYYQTIGTLPVTEEELALDFGYYDDDRKKYYDL